MRIRLRTNFLFQAFALPMLNTLSDDPYGIYALILTPTRELAIQIADQVGLGFFGQSPIFILKSLNQIISLVERQAILKSENTLAVGVPYAWRETFTRSRIASTITLSHLTKASALEKIDCCWKGKRSLLKVPIPYVLLAFSVTS